MPGTNSYDTNIAGFARKLSILYVQICYFGIAVKPG